MVSWPFYDLLREYTSVDACLISQKVVCMDTVGRRTIQTAGLPLTIIWGPYNGTLTVSGGVSLPNGKVPDIGWNIGFYCMHERLPIPY